jgi:cysteine-rich repeat protein
MRRFLFFTFGILLACLVLGIASPVFAQQTVDLESFAQQAGFATGVDLTVVIARLIRTFISILGIVAVCFILYGGWLWMSSKGEPDKIRKAQQVVVNAAIGLALTLASFVIAQFVLSFLAKSTGTISSGGSASSGNDPDFDTASSFHLSSLNTDCAESVKNLALQFVFSHPVSSSSVESGIRVAIDGGADVEGTFEISGRRVTFRPDTPCAEDATQFCFDPGVSYAVTLSPSVLRSTSGRELSCTSTYPCSYAFTVAADAAVDVLGPTLEMDAPEDEAVVYAGDHELLQTEAIDDVGVSSVDFYVEGEDIYSSGLSMSVYEDVVPLNYFFTDIAQEWNTEGYVTNEYYDIWSFGADCAGNEDTSDRITVRMFAASCGDGLLSEGEDEVDCGGDPDSATYCGACTGEECSTDADCAGGASCVEGICVSTPEISRVSPGDGAEGNLITISGSGFGTTAGTIAFLGTENGDSVETSAYVCGSTTSWSATQIVVQVPDGAVDGPLSVTTVDATTGSEDETDRTDDENGPYIADFDVNAIKRPGLCSIAPNPTEALQSVTLGGLHLGDRQGTSVLYFDYFEPRAYSAWSDTSITATVPLLDDGAYDAQVFAGDYYCEDSGDTCDDDADCDTSVSEPCVSMQCSETLGACVEDEDCGETGGECMSIRQGSNSLDLTIATVMETLPVISYVDTGWSACVGGANDGEYCTDSLEDCGTGSCEDKMNWGPVGQYVTIYGTDFGDTEGVVYFTDRTDGDYGDYYAYGDADFPEACGGEYWTDTLIIVKVPQTYTTDHALSTGAFEVHVVRGSDRAVSEPVDFTVVSGDPGPAICQLDPDSGPVGTPVDIIGEHLEVLDGTVEFYSGAFVESDDYTSWDQDEILDVLVPEGAQTGPVSVMTQTGKESNPLNFIVGDCREDEDLCDATETCCGDGSCAATAASCPSDATTDAHYAFRFTTATIPATPQVRQICSASEGLVSPTPWEGWSQPENICVNAPVSALFNMGMNSSTFNTSNIVVEKCVADGEDICEETEMALLTYTINRSAYGFIMTHRVDFDPSSTYRVTLLGGERAGRIQAHEREGAGYMAEDYVWQFTTSSSGAPCEVQDVYVNPATFLSTQIESIPYVAQLISQGDECVLAPCDDYTLAWASSSASALIGTPTTVSGSCEQTVTTAYETPPGSPALIEATVTDAEQTPTGTGQLFVNFGDPEIAQVFPNCDTACVNAGIRAEFTQDMDATYFSSASIKLYTCEDALCADGELTERTDTTLVPYSTYGVSILLPETTPLLANRYYRVWISGDVTSLSGVRLSDSGSNYGSDENLFFEDDYSWIFKTKTSSAYCAVDRVDIAPSETVATAIGQRQAFEAVPYGAPDDCSVGGQALQASFYSWSSWVSSDLLVATMLEGGSLLLSDDIPHWCSASCLRTGATIQIGEAICGDGDVDTGEECDGSSSCTTSCLNEGTEGCPLTCAASGASCERDSDCTTYACSLSGAVCTTETAATICIGTGETCDAQTDTCEVSGTLCCGNRIMEAGEDCDDGNQTDGGGCSSACLNEGSSAVGATCGNGFVDYTSTLGGEDCDDGNTIGGDGCSSQCLNEGSILASEVIAVCGDGSVDDGEDCDDGNLTSGDGCSSSCVFEGANACVFACFDGGSFGVNCVSDADCITGTCEAVHTPCCGDQITDYNADGISEAEDCDFGDTQDGDGCSSICLNEGASIVYETASHCGDSVYGTGEECEASSSGTFETGAYGVAEIAQTAPESVDPETHLAFSVVSTSADGEIGEGLYGVQCACETDASCGAPTLEQGCGTGGCCFERMTSGAYYPTGTDVCRNSAVWVDFSQNVDMASLNPSTDTDADGVIDPEEYDPNLYLEYTGADCPDAYYDVAYADTTPRSFLVRAWQWVVHTISSWFGREGHALSGVCVVPVEYHVSVIDTGRYRAYLDYEDLLISGTYQVVVVGDTDAEDATDEGVLSANGVGLSTAEFTTPTFTVGSELCDMDEVQVEDTGDITAAVYEDASEQFFSKIGEEHVFHATAYTVRSGTVQEIVSTSSYAWSWGWASSDTTGTILTVTQDTTETDEASVVAAGQNGNVAVLAQATITIDTSGEMEGESVTGQLPVRVLLCENPWLSSGSSIFRETTTNFSFAYCRDNGAEGTSDDLPAIGDADGDPIIVSSITTDILKELIFQVQGGRDAIGFRVVQNSEYLSPEDWYEVQGFEGSVSPVLVDGYEAATEETTTYILAANQSGTVLYPNIYVVSYNDDATEESQEIFTRILENLTFNSNSDVVSDINLCSVTAGTYVQKEDGSYISCDWDGNCLETCVEQGDGTSACSITGSDCSLDTDCALDASKLPFCDAEKSKLRRDTTRVRDVAAMEELFAVYGEANKHCEVTVDQLCSEDSQCPGTESCVEEVAAVTTGSFIPSYTVSVWPSWSAELGNSVGEALPTDPINAFYDCTDDGYDEASCWSGDVGLFVCPALSHVYTYRSVGGISYNLFAQLEYNGGAWAYDIDTDMTDFADLLVEYEYGNGKSYSGTVQDGFGVSSTFCDGGALGTSAICGDGIVDATTEYCEIGDTTAIPCDGSTGLINAACKEDCSGYQTEAEAEAAGAVCEPYDCGNGVVEGTEVCDDGDLNGTYGHCSDDCLSAGDFYCGDGYLAGGEECDCGNTQTWSALRTDTSSWTYAHCAISSISPASNGQYVATIAQSCEFDCTYPGPSCGDGITNGSEDCDGDIEEDTSVCGVDADGYQQYRYRTCDSFCRWGAWSSCVTGEEQCGNGILEGYEECDDGNDSDNDACLNTCEFNTCGDGYVYTGIESCDRGSGNGSVCSAAYDSTCQYCTTTCEYMTRTGAYCGDGIINGGELCDGSVIPYYYFDADSRSISGSCDASDVGTEESGYTCLEVGVCNGGEENGEYCTVSAASTHVDYQDCADGADCIAPSCASDCQSSCPFTYESASLQIQSELSGAQAQSSLALYSYLSGSSPDNASVIMPGCSIGQAITADIDTSGVVAPDVDIVFVTDLSGSMGTSQTDEGDYYIEVAAESLGDAISELFDAYASEAGSTLQIGLVSFSSAFDDDLYDCVVSDTYAEEGVSIDHDLVGRTGENDLLSIASGYTSCTGGGTPTFSGVRYASSLLQSSTADIKIMVLLSDGSPSMHYWDYGGGDLGDLDLVYCTAGQGAADRVTTDFTYTYPSGGTVYTGYEACVVEIKDLLVDAQHEEFEIYTATIGTSTSSLVGYMAHVSDEECAWDSLTSSGDCSLGSYAFSGTTTDEIESMYTTIIDSILGARATWITGVGGTTITTTGSVGGGRNITLPFPEGFACESDTFTIPLRLEFYGEGAVELSNLQLQYCPLE